MNEIEKYYLTFHTKKPALFGTKKSVVIITVTEEQVVDYFDNTATPYDLSYLFDRIDRDEVVLEWARKVALHSVPYNHAIRELNVTITDCVAEPAAYDTFRLMIRRIIDKHPNVRTNKTTANWNSNY